MFNIHTQRINNQTLTNLLNPNSNLMKNYTRFKSVHEIINETNI